MPDTKRSKERPPMLSYKCRCGEPIPVRLPAKSKRGTIELTCAKCGTTYTMNYTQDTPQTQEVQWWE